MIPDSPFAPGCSSQSFLETLAGGELLARVCDGLAAREPFLLLTGEPGTGKTVLSHEAIARLGSRVAAAYLAYPALSATELLEEILLRLGAEPPAGASRPKLLSCFERTLEGLAERERVALIVVDDAHALPAALLEELRLLVGVAQQSGRALEVMLVGLPSLEAALDDPSLAALRQRISVRAKLAPLSAGEVRRYLRHRVEAAGGDGGALFSRATCAEIASLSAGVPREINALAGEALRRARAANEASVGAGHVKAAAEKLRGQAPPATVRDEDDPELEAATPAPAQPTRAAAPAPPAQAPTAPKPAAPAQARTPAPVPTVKAPVRESSALKPITPPSQDPREWVARFVGDSGPLQIGSRATSHGTFGLEPLETLEPSAPGAPGASPAPARRASGASRSRARSERMRAVGAAIAALLAVAIVGGAIALIIRAGLLAVRKAQHPAHVASATPAPAPSVVPLHRSAPATVVRSEPTGPPSPEPAPQAPAPVERTRGPFTLEVGQDLDLQAAFDRRDRVQELVGIEAWVVPSPEGSAEPNRVVLGIYRTRERAESAASMLLRSRTLDQVTVVPLPSRRARR